jgi:hypothetical protein
MAITHKYTLMCDDIRQENNGKFIIIGLYTPNIVVPQVPFVLPTLAFFQMVECDRPGAFTVRMRLEHMDSGKKLVEGMGMMNIERPGPGVNAVKFGGVQFPGIGGYQYVVKIEDEREPLIFNFDVVIGVTVPQQLPPQA